MREEGDDDDFAYRYLVVSPCFADCHVWDTSELKVHSIGCPPVHSLPH